MAPNPSTWASNALRREEPIQILWNGITSAPFKVNTVDKNKADAYLEKHPNHVVFRSPGKGALAEEPDAVVTMSFITNGETVHFPLTRYYLQRNDLYEIAIGEGVEENCVPVMLTKKGVRVLVKPLTGPYPINWNGNIREIYLHSMEDDVVDSFLHQHGDWAILRQADQGTINYGKESNRNIIAMLTYMDNNGEIQTITLTADELTQDLHSMIMELDQRDISSLLIEQSNLDKEDPVGINQYRGGRSKSRRSKSRRVKKSKSRRSKSRRVKKSKSRRSKSRRVKKSKSRSRKQRK